MIKKAVFIVLLICSAVFAGAEEKKHDSQAARNPVIESMEITPNPVGSGDLFTLTIVVDHENSGDVEFPLDEIAPHTQLWRGPYIRSFIDTDKEGLSKRKVRITVTFKALHSGRIIIPGLTVTIGDRKLKTDPALLRVGLYRNRKLYMPLEVEWRAGFDKIYAGEAVPLSLTVKNQEVVVIFDRTRVASPRDGFFEEAGGVSGITTRTQGDIILYDIPAATYILTSPMAGEIKLPSSGVDYQGVTGWSDNLFLNINRIPPEIQESGAVGSFVYETSIDRSEADPGDNIVLTASVRGDGNLNYLKLPEPETEGCIFVSSETEDDFEPSPYGFSGVKTVRWIYTAGNQGETIISVPDFIFLDKQSDEVKTLNGRIHTVRVSEGRGETAADDAEMFPFEKLVSVSEDSGVWHNHYRYYFRYAWLLPGLVFFILVLIMNGKRLPLAGILSLIILIAVFSTGRFLIKPDTDEDNAVSPEMLYNSAIDAYEAGNTAACMHNLRSAVYYDPVNRLYRQTLTWIEHENGFVNSVSPSIQLHPDIFFYVLMAAVNGFFFAAVLKLVKPGGGVSVLIILFSFIMLFSTFMIVYSHHSRNRLTAVVCTDGSFLKKIPNETAEDWVPLEPGAALKILDDSDDFLLVETGLGVKGWLSESCVIPDR